ncbi:mycofactocin biosynthesis chaperone MftB [Streptomyces sp. L7]
MTAPTLDRALGLHPQISVRPEPFGALLYHFGTRRLTFLKDRRLLAVVVSLAGAPRPAPPASSAGVPEAGLPRYDRRALAALAESSMLVRKDPMSATAAGTWGWSTSSNPDSTRRSASPGN